LASFGLAPVAGMNNLTTLKTLFSLYVLFSHFRLHNATRGNGFFQMSSYANVCITNEKKEENSHEGITWSEMEKQNAQAKKAIT